METYVDGETSGAAAEALRSHLAACPECEALATFQGVMKRCVREACACAPPSEEVRNRLKARLRREATPPVPLRPRRTFVRYAALAAAAILLALVPLWRPLLTGQAPVPPAYASGLAEDHRNCWVLPCGGASAHRAQDWLQENPRVAGLLPAPSDVATVDVRLCHAPDGSPILHAMWEVPRPGGGEPYRVSLYACESRPNRDGPFSVDDLQGLVWQRDGYEFVLLGDAPEGDLERLAHALPESPSN